MFTFQIIAGAKYYLFANYKVNVNRSICHRVDYGTDSVRSVVVYAAEINDHATKFDVNYDHPLPTLKKSPMVWGFIGEPDGIRTY